jgi:peptide/nickel transport system substrate-binding protein
MKRSRSFFDLSQLHRFTIIGVILSSWIIPRPCLGKTLTIKGKENKLVVCIPSPIISLDPTSYRDRNTQTVLKNMFDSLTTRDNNMKVVPQLAESWEALDDTTWEFKLRRGVKFHNGDDFTAKDVSFTLKRVVREGALDGRTSPRKGLLGPLAAVRIVDNYTVQIQTEKPWAILPLMLTLQEMVPKRYMKAVGAEGFRKNPVGTGPFRFVRKEGEELLFLERFEDYYGGSPENPPVQAAPLKYLVFKTVPERIERIAMLKRGECDIITHVPSEAEGILEMVPGIKVLSRPATRSYFAEMNCAKSPLNDRRVRLAMNYAVDMNVVVDRILQGHGKVLPTVLLPNAFAYHTSQKPYPYDPNLAKELLTDAGFQEWFSVTISCIEDNRQFANIIAFFLTKLGVKPVIHVIDRDRPGALGGNARWDILVTSWGNSTLDPVGILTPKFSTGGRGNYSNYSNEEVDRLLFQAEGALDLRMREGYYKRVQEIIYSDVPMIFGYAAEERYGVREKVRNFIPSLSGMMNMHDVYIEDGD